MSKAIESAKKADKPSFIQLKTVIAWPAPNARNTAASHGAPLGESETKLTKEALGFDKDKTFQVPDEVINYTRQSKNRGSNLLKEWNDKFNSWASANPSLANDYQRLLKGELTQEIDKKLTIFESGTSVASRKSSGTILNELSANLVELVGGSADLAESNGVALKNALSMQKSNSYIANSAVGGKYLHFGIREHAMGSIMNGMALYGFTRPFGATFLIFSDYQKPAIRLASIMQLPVTYVWTHDSIGLGEDGPTHQPVEQLWSLRSIPGFAVVRPCDANEVAVCWLKIMEDRKPAGIVLTRQNIPTLDRKINAPAINARKGAYILQDAPNSNPDVILIATGSEIELALNSQKELNSQSINTRVVSMPCVEWFQDQPASYQESVLPKNVKAKIAIEAGSTFGWYQFVGLEGGVVGLDRYGASGKPDLLYKEFGITVEKIVAKAKELKK